VTIVSLGNIKFALTDTLIWTQDMISIVFKSSTKIVGCTIVGTSSPKAAHTGGGGGRGGAVMTAVNRWHAATRSDGAINQACSQVAGTFRMAIPCVSTSVPLHTEMH